MKTRIIKSAGIFFLGMLMVTAVNAQSPRQGGRGLGPCGAGQGPGNGMGNGMGLNQSEYAQNGRAGQGVWMDLTDEQQTAMTSLRIEHYKVITPLNNKMTELKARERTLLSEEVVDMKAVNKTIDEQTDLMNSMRKLQTEHLVAVKSNLTDEQVMKLQQRRQFAHRDGFRGKGGRRGAGISRGYRGM